MNRLRRRHAVHSGHTDIHDDDSRPQLLKRAHGLDAILRLHDLKQIAEMLLQFFAESHPLKHLIIHDHYLVHVPSPPSFSPPLFPEARNESRITVPQFSLLSMKNCPSSHME